MSWADLGGRFCAALVLTLAATFGLVWLGDHLF